MTTLEKSVQREVNPQIPITQFMIGAPFRAAALTHDEMETRGFMKKAVAGGPDPKIVRFTVSSTLTDTGGHIMKVAALNQIIKQSLGRTFFLNHMYDVPENVFGSIIGGELVQRTLMDLLSGEEKECTCLDLFVQVEETLVRAMATYDIITGGVVTLGASLGFYLLKGNPLDDGRIEVETVYFIECSCVGVPSNQQSWAQYAKSFELPEGVQLDELPFEVRRAALLWETSKDGGAPTNPTSVLAQLSAPDPEREIAGSEILKALTPQFIEQLKALVAAPVPAPVAATETPAEVTVIKKSMYAGAQAEETAMETVYDCIYPLLDAMYDLMRLNEEGRLDDAVGELDAILVDFGLAIKTVMVPALKANKNSGANVNDDTTKSAKGGEQVVMSGNENELTKPGELLRRILNPPVAQLVEAEFGEIKALDPGMVAVQLSQAAAGTDPLGDLLVHALGLVLAANAIQKLSDESSSEEGEAEGEAEGEEGEAEGQPGSADTGSASQNGGGESEVQKQLHLMQAQMNSLQSQITTLTAEKLEAEKIATEALELVEELNRQPLPRA
jgi:hypothetical protein